ncbi:methyltransferase domain-containing protein [Actinomadura terrae]|uniref:methyltransferase domain-containing protein n=1 Tax=Actinomadura terrae TaxID=604353 RepID=UPI001FA75352|nr:methyltransferase domain-containing protein [Actinomadura terrae]
MGPTIELDSRAAGAIDGRHIRALTFQDVRLEYVTSVLNRHKIAPSGRTALVIGSGRGLLAEGLARLGLNVVALDPSPEATAMAEESGTGAVQYMTARAENPGLDGASFDVLFYADTFEITDDFDRVVAHAARLLSPDGVLFYDTVNRTPVSRLIYLGAFQALPQTRIMPRGRYTAARLRTPAEVASALAAHGLANEDICPFKPKNVLDLVKATIARRRGKVDDRAVKEMTDFVLEPKGKPLVTYLGHARTKH